MNSLAESRKQKVLTIRKNTYQPPKLSHCYEHSLPKAFFCPEQTCPNLNQLRCKDCSHEHPLISVTKIVPMLSQWVGQQWEEVERQNREIFQDWRNTEINLTYCIDILKQLLKQIVDKHSQGKQLLHLPALEDITGRVYEMLELRSPESTIREFKKLNDKYNLFSKMEKEREREKVKCGISDEERVMRLKKNRKISSKSKKFSEQSLIFSEQLARTIEDKMAREKRVNKIKQLEAQKIMSLNDLYKKSKEEMENMGQLLIELNQKPDKSQQGNLDQFLRGCENLKILHINNQNGHIVPLIWDQITSQMEFLKNLKELRLNLRAKDLAALIKLFQERPNSVRHIDRLSLKISDQPNLDLQEVATFCNCLQLKWLFLTLTRDNITKFPAIQFLRKLRIHTSLTNLPMNQFSLNMSKNKLQSSDTRQLQQFFRKKCDAIKKKNIQL